MNGMSVIWISQFGHPDHLQIRRVPKPEPGPDELLIRVRAAALNRADLLQIQGTYPAAPGVPPEIPGIEFAGEIESIGSRVSGWKTSQRVFGLVGGGALAEWITTHASLVVEIPHNLNLAQAAAIPEAFITAHDALWNQAALRPGETVLIHAVGSGVGLAAVQLARALHGIPFGTSRTGEKIEKAREYGLEAGWVAEQQ